MARLLLLMTDRDLGEAVDPVRRRLEPGAELCTDWEADPDDFDRVVLVLAGRWEGGPHVGAWGCADAGKRSLLLSAPGASWPPPDSVEQDAAPTLEAFRQRHSEAQTFSGLEDLVGKVAALV